MSILSRRTLLRAGAIATCVTSGAAAQAAPAAAPKLGELRAVGAVHLTTSCQPAAQQGFARGFALLHSFFYEEARRVFSEAATADPSCAMAHWGVAMTYYHPIWAPPDESDLKAGTAAVDKAKALGGGKTELEKGLIAAAAAFYSTNTPAPAPAPGAPGKAPVGVLACHGDAKKTPDHSSRAKAYAAAIEKLYAAHPDDVELTTLHALALLGTATPGDPALTNQKKAAGLLEPLLVKFPDHPGVLHYYIHACDYPPMAKQALPSAQRYAKIAPWVPHVLHMPSHIFTRLGMWAESAASNVASADAARAYAAAKHPDAASFEELHALDYLVYAYLQTGSDKKAQAVLDQLRVIKKSMPETDLAVAQAQGAIPARVALERGKWADAAALEVPPAPYWAKFPFTEAHLHFARGVGGARSGKIEIAKAASARLGELRKLVTDPKFKIWAMTLEFEQKAVDALILQATGFETDARSLLVQAADLEDKVGLHPVSPAPLLPVRELLGDMFLLQFRPEDALKAFETSLAMRPNRYFATFGAVRAARAAKDKVALKKHALALLALAKLGDNNRPELPFIRNDAK